MTEENARKNNVEIAKTLCVEETRFVLVAPNEKRPIEKGWQNRGYVWEAQNLKNHLKNNGNYGVICGPGNVRVLDIDIPGLGMELRKKLNTFTVQTGSGGTHFYIVSDYDKNNTLPGKKGEMRCQNQMVVGPDSNHPNGNKYIVVNDVPLMQFSKEEWGKFLEDEGLLKKEISKVERQESSSNNLKSRSEFEFKIICNLIRRKATKEQIFEHMMNYAKWSEEGEHYQELTYQNAQKAVEEEAGVTKEAPIDFTVYTAKSLLQSVDDEQEPLIDGFVKETGIVITSGSPGAGKSFSMLHMGVAGSAGVPLFGKIQSKRLRVLYIDEENRKDRQKKRLKLILNGLELNPEQVNTHFLINAGVKLDSFDPEKMKLNEKIIAYIKEHNINLVIVDSVVRVMVGSENEVKDVRIIYETVRRMAEECRCAFILIHHNRKVKGASSETDIRGSGDFLAMVDAAFNFSKIGSEGNVFRLDSWKGRDGDNLKSFIFEIARINDPREGDLYDFSKEEGVQFRYLGDVNGKEDVKNLMEVTEEQIIEFLEGSDKVLFRNLEILNHAKKFCSKSTFDKAMTSLLRKQLLIKEGRGIYRYAPKGESPD